MRHQHLSGFVPLCIVEHQERDPQPLNIFQGQSVLRPSLLQVEILDPIVIPREGDDGLLLIKKSLPFQGETKLDSVVMVNF